MLTGRGVLTVRDFLSFSFVSLSLISSLYSLQTQWNKSKTTTALVKRPILYQTTRENDQALERNSTERLATAQSAARLVARKELMKRTLVQLASDTRSRAADAEARMSELETASEGAASGHGDERSDNEDEEDEADRELDDIFVDCEDGPGSPRPPSSSPSSSVYGTPTASSSSDARMRSRFWGGSSGEESDSEEEEQEQEEEERAESSDGEELEEEVEEEEGGRAGTKRRVPVGSDTVSRSSSKRSRRSGGGRKGWY